MCDERTLKKGGREKGVQFALKVCARSGVCGADAWEVPPREMLCALGAHSVQHGHNEWRRNSAALRGAST